MSGHDRGRDRTGVGPEIGPCRPPDARLGACSAVGGGRLRGGVDHLVPDRSAAADVVEHHAGRGAAGYPDPAGRARRAVGRARRGHQHRPGRHDDPGHLGRRLGGLPVGSAGRAGRRRGVRRAWRAGARGGDGDLRDQPHRVRRGDQPARRGHREVPLDAAIRAGLAEPAGVAAGTQVRHLLGATAGHLAGAAGEPAAGRDLRRRGHRRRPGHRGVAADHAGVPAGAGELPGAVALALRAAAAVLRREPGRGGVARRERLPLQVLRGDHLRGVGRTRWRGADPQPRAGGLPGGPDQQPGLHRSGGDDLRQLAARWAARRRGAVRLLRRPAAAQRRDHRARIALRGDIGAARGRGPAALAA